MPGRDIIVIGASAGGVDALKQVVHGLSPDLPAALFVVLHVPAHGPSVLPRILARAGHLRAIHPQDGETIRPGTIYVAPPDYHLLVKRGRVRVSRGPRENSHRPAADALFRTAARSYGPRVVGVVLSGVLDDGTAGLMAIKRMGGTAVVQDPTDALYSGMPQSALDHVGADYCLPAADLAPLLVRLVGEPLPDASRGFPHPPEELEMEADMAELEPEVVHTDRKPGIPSVFACPECGGTLWEFHEHELLRFRCRVGHAWSAESLLAEQSQGLEAALWTALRALEEQAALARRMVDRAEGRGQERVASTFRGQAAEAEGHAEIIRRVLVTRRPDPSTEPFEAREPAATGPPAAGGNGPPA
ncbi:MAG TPA: chemotaxis protein CheB [Gemmataceae bacterium]|nr:chemotaxis protein CheB [Gemmataceae bacterium]